MKKPIKRISLVDTFASMNIGDSVEFKLRDVNESGVRKAASTYATANGITLSVAFDKQRFVSLVTRTA